MSTIHFRIDAELVASILKVGGLMHAESNAGAATPTSLYKMYSKNAAVAANPYTLRAINSQVGGGLKFTTISKGSASASTGTSVDHNRLMLGGMAKPAPGGSARRSDSPPRASFKLLNNRATPVAQQPIAGLTLTLNSLK